MGKVLLPSGAIQKYAKNERVKRQGEISLAVKQALKKPVPKRVIKPDRILKLHDPKGEIQRLEKHMTPGMKKPFKRTYRAIWDAQDEIVRTSFVTDLLVNLEKAKLPKVELDKLKSIVDAFSNVRFPTRWSGFKLKNGDRIGEFTEMQHPTAKGAGMWNPAISGFTKAHGALDEARVKVAIDAAMAFVKVDASGNVTLKPNATGEAIAKAIIVAAGTFTLRAFTAPATADNVDPTGLSAVRIAQTKSREFLKDQLRSLGATEAALPPTIPKLNLPQRDFRPDLLQPGEVSPRRYPAIDATEAAKLWVVA